MTQTARQRNWVYAVGGSLLIHLFVAVGVLLPDFAILKHLRQVLSGQGGVVTIAVDYETPLDITEQAAIDPGGEPSDVRARLKKEIAEAQELPPEQLAARLETNRAALKEMPREHLEEITASLGQVLPSSNYRVTSKTNEEGVLDYWLTYTNAAGELEELVFDADAREPGGFLSLAEDPLIAPLLRFVLPMTDVGVTNRAPANPPGD